MGFLHKLWDETLAGPAPESGLGRLRKYNSFSAVRSPNHPLAASRFHDHHRRPDHLHRVDDDPTVPVSRSITILKPKNLSVEPGSGPASPASSSGSNTPFSPGTPRDGDVNKRFTRKKHAWDAMEHAEGGSPTAYDWIMISALDR